MPDDSLRAIQRSSCAQAVPCVVVIAAAVGHVAVVSCQIESSIIVFYRLQRFQAVCVIASMKLLNTSWYAVSHATSYVQYIFRVRFCRPFSRFM